MPAVIPIPGEARGMTAFPDNQGLSDSTRSSLKNARTCRMNPMSFNSLMEEAKLRKR